MAMNKTLEGLKEKTKEIFDMERKLDKLYKQRKTRDNQISRTEQEATAIATIEWLFNSYFYSSERI